MALEDTPSGPHPGPSRTASVASVSSLAPSDSISHISSRAPSTSIRSRRSHSQIAVGAQPDWTEARQFFFERLLIRLTASAGLPLTWVENPEFLSLCNKFIPAAKVPSRKVLTSRLLPRAVDGIRLEIRKAVTGMHATAQADGWSGINSHHYIAFMATVNGNVSMLYYFMFTLLIAIYLYQVHTVRVHDASGERKTADNLYQLMLEVLATLEIDWKVIVVGFTTDASGEARLARSKLSQSHPHLICPDCYAHQVSYPILIM